MIHSAKMRLAALATGLALAAAVAVATHPDPSAAPPPAVVQVPVAAEDGPPPAVTVRTLRPGTAPGLLFVTPQSPGAPFAPRGPQIVDNQGRPVWFHRIPNGQFATSFRVQTYQGRKVLTWWQGTSDAGGMGMGVGYIADEDYRIIATVSASRAAGLHEFRITPEGTAILTTTRSVPADLQRYGGTADGAVVENGFEEIDIATGQVLLSWNSLEHVPISHTEAWAQNDSLDYFHLNSVDLDADGDFIISARHTSTVYRLNRQTGQIIWRLGGRFSDFRLGVGVRFGWQHDASMESANVVRIFDNATAPRFEGYESRVAWVRLDHRRSTASLVRQAIHPELMSVAVEGGAFGLPNGNTVVSWGSSARISEFSPQGVLLLDATMPDRHSSYRAYRFDWRARPDTPPTVRVDADATVHAVWNGATGIARWRLLGGPTEGDLRRVTQVAWNGLDTPIALPAEQLRQLRYLKVEAVDANGRVVGTSPVTPTGY